MPLPLLEVILMRAGPPPLAEKVLSSRSKARIDRWWRSLSS